MKWSIGKKLGTGFGLALAALSLLGFISYRSTLKLDEANNFETDTYKVIVELGDVRADLYEAETGHFRPSTELKKDLDELVDSAKKSDNVHKQSLNALVSKINAWIDIH